MTAGAITAVVLAGGTSRRFGSDKLTESLEGGTVLSTALAGLPVGVRVIVVGAAPVGLSGVRVVREDPPGGGPAAAMVAGLRAALTEGFDIALVLPGDAPLAGRSAGELLDGLSAAPDAGALVAMDPNGREQPLQLALRPAAARALVEAAGPDEAAGGSARRLLHTLTPPARPYRLTAAAVFDIDTPAQLSAWLLQTSAAVAEILAAVDRVRAGRGGLRRPVVVALDGPGGSGRSTLAAALSLRTDAVVVPADDFCNPADQVFDWERLRAEALGPLAAGAPATYRPYDRVAADGRLRRAVTLEPQPLVVLEGVYAARPELADLLDLTVYVATPADVTVS